MDTIDDVSSDEDVSEVSDTTGVRFGRLRLALFLASDVCWEANALGVAVISICYRWQKTRGQWIGKLVSRSDIYNNPFSIGYIHSRRHTVIAIVDSFSYNLKIMSMIVFPLGKFEAVGIEKNEKKATHHPRESAPPPQPAPNDGPIHLHRCPSLRTLLNDF